MTTRGEATKIPQVSSRWLACFQLLWDRVTGRIFNIFVRASREVYFVKKFFLPANSREVFRCLTQYVEKDGLISKRILRKLFPKFPADWPRHRKIRSGEGIGTQFLDYCLANYERSSSQLCQDLMVLFFLGEKTGGYFVEFGATNGVDLSNSLQLEKRFGWRGILAEPGRCWHSMLRANRNCNIDYRCVWRVSGELLEFCESDVAEFSTIQPSGDHASRALAATNGRKYFVETISLEELLRFHGSPRDIDYLSIDTEGSEWKILSTFDFDGRNIKIITVEHNYVSGNREKLYQLISRGGFVRVLEEFSYFEDWYIQPNLIRARDAAM